jgi:hypothetical protein
MHQDLRAQAAADQIANRERSERTVFVEVGSEHRAGGPNAGAGERLLKPRRRQVDDGDGIPD